MMNNLSKKIIGVLITLGVLGVAYGASFDTATTKDVTVYSAKRFTASQDVSQEIPIDKGVGAIRIDYLSSDFTDNAHFAFEVYLSVDGGESQFLGSQDITWNGAIVSSNEVIDHPSVEINLPDSQSNRTVILKTKASTKDVTADVKIKEISEVSTIGVSHAAATYVQSNVCDGCTTLAYPSNVTAGNFLVVAFRCGAPGGVITATDTRGNTYNSSVQQANSADSNTTLTILYAMNTTGGANTVDPGTSENPCGTRRWIVAEYSGIATSAAQDQSTAKEWAGAASVTTSSLTPSQANELVICAQQTGNFTWSISAPFSTRQTGNKITLADKTISAVASQSCTATGTSDNGSIGMVLYKEPGGSPTPTPAPSIEGLVNSSWIS